MRNLVYYIAASLDGFIADTDGDFSAFPQDPATLQALFTRYPETCPSHVREALGVTAPSRRFDAVIMGARTHRPAIDVGLADGAYPHLSQYVVTNTELPPSPAMERVCGDVASFVADLKTQPGMDIWLCGGADLATQLVDQIDEIQVKVNPIIMGGGTPLVHAVGRPRPMILTEAERLPGGVLLNTYRPEV